MMGSGQVKGKRINELHISVDLTPMERRLHKNDFTTVRKFKSYPDRKEL